jgi:hypothetical protein
VTTCSTALDAYAQTASSRPVNASTLVGGLQQRVPGTRLAWTSSVMIAKSHGSPAIGTHVDPYPTVNDSGVISSRHQIGRWPGLSIPGRLFRRIPGEPSAAVATGLRVTQDIVREIRIDPRRATAVQTMCRLS